MPFTESNYENAVLQLFTQSLGYSYAYGPVPSWQLFPGGWPAYRCWSIVIYACPRILSKGGGVMTRPLLFRCISGQSALHRLNGSLNNGVIRHIRQGNMILTLIELVVLGSSGQSILIAGPGAAGNAHHGIPGHSHSQNGIHTLRAVQNHAEATIDGISDSGLAIL